MDKLKLYSPQKDIISTTMLDNNFVNTGNYNNPIKYYNRSSFKNEDITIDITSFGTNIFVNPTIYLKGNNIEQITNYEMLNFIEQFEYDLKIDSDLLRLTGFDFNQNIYTNLPPKNYLNLFRVLPKYDKTIHKNKTGITFKNDCKSLVIYDKKKEMDKKKTIIPQTHQDKNVLRIELCVNEKMKQTNNLKYINTMKDVTTPDNYNNIVNEWQGTFNKINKQQTFFKIRNLIPSPEMDIQDEAILNHINEITMEGYFNKIDAKVNLGFITPKQAKTRKEKALSVWNEFISQPENSKFDLLSEINEKVSQTAKIIMI